MKSFFRIIPKICLILTILIGCEIAESDELFNQGTGLLREGQYDQAIALFSEAIEINPRNADAYHNRGLAYALKGQLEKATSDLNKAIELDPRYDKKAWLEKHEDILSVLQKSLSLHQTEVNKEIFTDNAILKQEDGRTGRMHKFKGLKEIENWRQENEKKWSLIATYPISIEKEADTAHVKCFIFIEDLETGEEFIKLSCSTKMLKIGPTWKIREQIIKNRSK